jgi:cytochrome b6-f complex iron-sulfur subunit
MLHAVVRFLALVASASALVVSPVATIRPQAASVAAPAISMAAADGFVPDMQRRTIMNLVLLGGAGVPVLWLGGGFVYFFVPPSGGGGGGGLTAKDALGDDVKVDVWAKAHPYPERSLVQGLKGDAHYLIVEQDGKIRDYAINAVCTHLGCVVPWNRAQNK